MEEVLINGIKGVDAILDTEVELQDELYYNVKYQKFNSIDY